MRNASVFPEPVFAAPKISLPPNACNIDAPWISVIFVKPALSNPTLR